MLKEFNIIKNHFLKASYKSQRTDVKLGIGDDCALLKVPTDHWLAVSTDTLVAGIHFPLSTLPSDIGYKALAVNLSDLAAMGAQPAWVSLALTLPYADEQWLSQFVEGFFKLIDEYKLQLIGGDTTQGTVLSITVNVYGFVKEHAALKRSGAKPGDLIYVTGTLGDAGLALAAIENKINLSNADREIILSRLNRPIPRIEAGLALVGYANSAIDISDGLAADLRHILSSSQVGATLWSYALPLSSIVKQAIPQQQALELALTAGDDYELCFSALPDHAPMINNLLSPYCYATCIGKIESDLGLRLCNEKGLITEYKHEGYEHFAKSSIDFVNNTYK